MIDFFFRYSSIIYLLGIILLIAVLIFGNEVKGAKSWFSLMGFSLQPSEFMKPITTLALAKCPRIALVVRFTFLKPEPS